MFSPNTIKKKTKTNKQKRDKQAQTFGSTDGLTHLKKVNILNYLCKIKLSTVRIWKRTSFRG